MPELDLEHMLAVSSAVSLARVYLGSSGRSRANILNCWKSCGGKREGEGGDQAKCN